MAKRGRGNGNGPLHKFEMDSQTSTRFCGRFVMNQRTADELFMPCEGVCVCECMNVWIHACMGLQLLQICAC